LQALGLNAMNVTPDPVLIATEGALWGAIHHQGLLSGKAKLWDSGYSQEQPKARNSPDGKAYVASY
jgi:hypothetical protein